MGRDPQPCTTDKPPFITNVLYDVRFFVTVNQLLNFKFYPALMSSKWLTDVTPKYCYSEMNLTPAITPLSLLTWPSCNTRKKSTIIGVAHTVSPNLFLNSYLSPSWDPSLPKLSSTDWRFSCKSSGETIFAAIFVNKLVPRWIAKCVNKRGETTQQTQLGHGVFPCDLPVESDFIVY